jgi:hypothetical protein
MKKVMKKAAMGSKMGPKTKVKTVKTVKTVDRGMLPNVTFKSDPMLGLGYKPSDKDIQIDTTLKKKNGGKMKKAKDGGAFGMLSVKAGIDKNPKPTAADRIAGAKKMAKSGTSMKKCKYGCK